MVDNKTMLIREWEQALAFSENRSIKLRNYARKRLAELRTTPDDVEKSAERRIKAHRAYSYNVDKSEESKRARNAAVEKAGAHARRHWQSHEIDYIHKNFKAKTILEIALALNRSYESVMHKVNREGLIRNRKWITNP